MYQHHPDHIYLDLAKRVRLLFDIVYMVRSPFQYCLFISITKKFPINNMDTLAT